MLPKYKIDKLKLNSEVWFFAKESTPLSKTYLFMLWSGMSLFLFLKGWDILIPIGYLLVYNLPTIQLPIYQKIKSIWGLSNPTRHRAMARNLIKLRRNQNEKEKPKKS